MNKNTTSSEYKQLNTLIAKIDAEIITNKEEIKLKQKELSVKESKKKELQERLDELRSSSTEPIVSEHAILRYLERVEGLNIEEVKAKILTDKVKAQINFAKSCEINNSQYKIVVKNNVIVTIKD
ncbi:TPA: hypothetical protein MYP09_001418 [Citrobacter farmeri]|nr:hypothetical protein [Citrobacter farmeri]